MCDQWATDFQDALAETGADLDAGLARAGITLLHELPRTAKECVLLCTDLHAGNVLSAEREPWLVIDPKPYLGDPAYDVVKHMLNCDTRLLTNPAGLCRRMAALADLDPERVTQWLFTRCIQESIAQPLLYQVATRIAP